MPRVQAERELAASVQEAWGFIAEPYHLPDWWPGIAAVQPDRRGVAPGARWQVRGSDRPSLLRSRDRGGMLLVHAVEPPYRFHFVLLAERIEAELRLAPLGADRTLATLTVRGPWLIGLGRSFPRKALARLHDLCQLSASFDPEI